MQENRPSESIVHTAETLQEGMQAGFSVLMTEEVVNSFSELSGDFNPLHNSSEFAKSLGFKQRVVHGAIQQAFISRLIGMYIPGRFSIIKKLVSNYTSPAYVGDSLDVEGRLIKWDQAASSGQVEVKIFTADRRAISYSIVDIGLTSLPSQSNTSTKFNQISKSLSTESTQQLKSTILFLGGSSALARELRKYETLQDFHIVSVGRRDCDYYLDFAKVTTDAFVEILSQTNPFGVVHFASLPPTKGPTWDLEIQVLLDNIKIMMEPMKILAKLKAAQQPVPYMQNFKRLVAITSSYGRHLLPEKGYDGYGYAKMLQSYYTQDLARDLARFQVSVNAIAPAEMPLGMNAGLAPRTQAMLAARTPSGRMTSIEDVAHCLKFLLSQESEAISGQEFVLAGGRSR